MRDGAGWRSRIVGPFLVACALAACDPLGTRLPGKDGQPAAPSPPVVSEAAPAPGPSPPPAPPEPEPEPEPRSFSVAVTGDLLPHSPVIARAREYGAAAGPGGSAYDFRPMLAEVRPVLEAADLALCHLETPLTPDGTDIGRYPAFNTPGELAAAVADAGYDGCSTASNHALDRGQPGVVATLDVLEAAGLGAAGTARSPEEGLQVTTYEVVGVQVAHLAATYGTNGIPVPAEAPWLVDLLDPAAILADAAAATASGAEFVIVSLHWGVEYQSEPTPEQRALAEQLAASPDIDLLVGHHAHVIQPVERIGETLVVYGLGNFLSNQHAGCCAAATQDGMILAVEVTEDVAAAAFRINAVTATPTFVERPTYRVLPVLRTLADPGIPPDLRAQLEGSLARTSAVVGTDVATLE